MARKKKVVAVVPAPVAAIAAVEAEGAAISKGNDFFGSVPVCVAAANFAIDFEFKQGFEASRIEFSPTVSGLMIAIKWRKSATPKKKIIAATTDPSAWGGKTGYNHPAFQVISSNRMDTFYENWHFSIDDQA